MFEKPTKEQEANYAKLIEFVHEHEESWIPRKDQSVFAAGTYTWSPAYEPGKLEPGKFMGCLDVANDFAQQIGARLLGGGFFSTPEPLHSRIWSDFFGQRITSDQMDEIRHYIEVEQARRSEGIVSIFCPPYVYTNLTPFGNLEVSLQRINDLEWYSGLHNLYKIAQHLYANPKVHVRFYDFDFQKNTWSLSASPAILPVKVDPSIEASRQTPLAALKEKGARALRDGREMLGKAFGHKN